MRKPGKAPTMSDVARVTGVSSMTVSRAFKDDASVSKETRDRIRKAAEKLGYVIDSTASGLSSRRTGFVAVVIPSINNANFADTLRGLTEGLRSTNLQLLLGYTDYDVKEEERLVELFLRRRPEAVIVTGGYHTARCRKFLKNAGVPVAEMWDLPSKPIDHVVGFSNAAAAELMVHHFHDQGFRKIGFIGGDTSRDTRGKDRRAGFVAALEKLGLDTTRIIAWGTPPITMREGASAMRQMLEQWPDTEAVMCVSDLSAFGAMTECQRAGLSVPGDIAIGGFGSYDLSELAIPDITTIDVGARDIGRHVADWLRTVLTDSPGQAVDSVSIEPKLLARGSTLRSLQTSD
ncbi:MAG: LacI family DNA-binding transcriptional regulator [Alphaproteobacteria bacterium]|nr:LacI family DNA-binding transcriptional regulator [Alphaproteobacteria bacterium]